MSLAIAARFAQRELRAGLRGFGIFLACLALGVGAIAALGSVRAGINAGLAREGAAILGGDAEIELTYRFADASERAWMAQHAITVSEIIDFRSMAVVDQGAQAERALTQVKAIDTAYPLLGTVTLTPDIPLDTALADFGAVMERTLSDRLGLQVGDEFMLGTQPLTLRATLVSAPDDAAAGFALGPRTFVYRSALDNAELLAPGTLFSSKYRLDLPADVDLSALEIKARARFENSGIRWRDARNGAPGVARFVERLGAFLVLVGLSGLAVGGIGVSSAVRAYLAQKTTVIATLRTLGASRAVIFQTYFIQIAVLSALGIIIGLTLGALVPLALAPLLEARLPIPAAFGIYPAPLIEAAIYGTLTAFIFTLWPLARADDVRAATLFRDALSSSRTLPAPPFLIAITLALALLIGLATWFSGTWRLTLWTAGGIACSLTLLIIAARIIRWGAAHARRLGIGRPALRWALASIAGPRDEAGAVVLSLGLGLSVLAAVGQIDGTMRNAITGNLPAIAPSYFFVDIQKDQIAGYSARLAKDSAVTRVDSAPMLRGVITQINGKPAREIAGEHWVLRGDRGVTYAAEFDTRSTLTAGTWWAPDYDGPPLISFATEEAKEMNLTLGDTMTVNILGRDITGTIASFREVDFSTAGIGFVLTMNPSALQGAPHSYISTVYAAPEAEAQILRDLATAYPNITAIRVRDAIERVASVLGSIAAATSYGAAASLLTGVLVLIGSAAAGTDARTYEAAILRTLGASRTRILFSFALRAAILGFGAGIVALGAGLLGGWAVSRFVLEVNFNVIWPSAFSIIAAGIGANVLANLAFAWRPLAMRPAQVLRASE